MRKLLEYGKAYGKKVVEGWITPGDKHPDSETDEEDDSNDERERRSEAENLAKGLFEWRRKGWGLGKGEETWGMAARKQMVALAGVVKTLPSKGE